MSVSIRQLSSANAGVDQVFNSVRAIAAITVFCLCNGQS